MYSPIDNRKKFVVFAIEEYRNRKGIDGKTAITLFTKSGLLQYIEDFYDVLHSNGTEYLIADFDDYFKNRNMNDYNLNEEEKAAFAKIFPSRF
ncbi:hypothetical protein FACS189421_12020 [Bacteroidia bacterium]|nr:hypothetical protein FACS189421_12020 [Bacteroidia bacterium]GHT04905.1 hypothetical protein FACS189423_08290 [Bacteroidia bacterium]